MQGGRRPELIPIHVNWWHWPGPHIWRQMLTGERDQTVNPSADRLFHLMCECVKLNITHTHTHTQLYLVGRQEVLRGSNVGHNSPGSLTEMLGSGVRRGLGVCMERVEDTVPGLTVVYLNPVSCEALCVYPACYAPWKIPAGGTLSRGLWTTTTSPHAEHIPSHPPPLSGYGHLSAGAHMIANNFKGLLYWHHKLKGEFNQFYIKILEYYSVCEKRHVVSSLALELLLMSSGLSKFGHLSQKLGA